MKKTILSTFLMTIALVGSSLSGYNYSRNRAYIKRSSGTASVYGFYQIGDNLKYEGDYTLPDVIGSGSKYRYNTLSLWVGIYSYTIPSENVKFYFVLTYNKLNTNSDSLQNGYYRIVSKFLKVEIEASLTGTSSSNLLFRGYSPEVYGNTNTTETYEHSFGITAGGDIDGPSGSIDFGFSHSITVFSDCVIMTPSSLNKKVTLNFDFQNEDLKAINGHAPYRGDFIQRCSAIYEVKNYYSSSFSTKINFNIHTTAQSQKYVTAGRHCNPCEVKTIEQNFDKSFYFKE